MLELFTVIGGLFGMGFIAGLERKWKSTMILGIVSVLFLTVGVFYL